MRASVRGPRPPVVTLALIATCVLAFLYETALPTWALNQLIEALGVVPARQVAVLLHAPTRLDVIVLPVLASMFLHGGWGHLLGNMAYLWVFGSGLESRFGSARFLALYAAAGVAASQAQVISQPLSDVPMIGASGAIAGVLGAYLIAFPRSAVTVVVPIFFWPLFFDVPALIFLAIWFFEQLFAATTLALSPYAAQAGGVAWWAHVGGFIAGAVLLRAYGGAPPRRAPRDARYGWTPYR